jgi:septum site-determining protein MinD
MAKIVVVTSGKGGVGKTTTSASFASGLALRGHKTAVIDFDVGLRNLDLIMGCERRVVYDLINVIQGEANLNQALIKDKQCDNLFVLAASQTRDKDALTQDGVEKVLTTWPAWALNTSSATRPPASKAARSWPCTLPTRRWW